MTHDCVKSLSSASFAVVLRIISFKLSCQCLCPRRVVLRPRLQVAVVAEAYWACGWGCWSISRSRKTASRASLGWPEPWTCWQTWHRSGTTHCSPFTTSASALPTSRMSLLMVWKGSFTFLDLTQGYKSVKTGMYKKLFVFFAYISVSCIHSVNQ